MLAPHQLATEESVQSAVKAFFDKVSLSRPQPKLCPQCGREMQYLQARFSLAGTELTWQVLLPVCVCELENPPQRPSIVQ
jgi:hypothetical protein